MEVLVQLMKNNLWSSEEDNYLKESLGKVSPKQLSRKLKRSSSSIKQRYLKKYNVTLFQCLIGHDFLIQAEVCEKLGLTLTQLRTFIKNNFIKTKNISNYSCISFEETEKLENFLSSFITIKRASEILNISTAKLKFKISTNNQFLNNYQKIGKLTYINKEQVIKYKSILISTYKLREISKLIPCDPSTIENYIHNDKIKFLKDGKQYRIYKTEVNKLKALLK